jgi:hypothetical protein
MVTDRTAWMAERGLRSFRGAAEAVAEQEGADDCPVWVLVEDGSIVGCTTAFDQSPAWASTEEERSRSALFLASTWTAPTRGRRLGHLIARWALDHAARSGLESVRRGAFEPRLMHYYCRVQGWTLLREMERRGRTGHIMTRPAERQPALALTAGPSATCGRRADA